MIYLMDNDSILQFHIDVFRPNTIPMARLAEYMAALAALYGCETNVHFDKMRTGSAVLQVTIDEPAIPKVSNRLHIVYDADAPDDLRKAYANINNLLRDDNAVGKIKKEKGAAILKFPGRETVVQKTYKVREAGILDGVVIRVGGKDSTIPVWLQDQMGNTHYCEANKDMARDLVKHYLGSPIRVTGQGDWLRGEDGQWKLERFKITDWSVLDETPIEEILNTARHATGNGWNDVDDPIKEHLIIRGSE
jgi:hypothetical protein